MKPYKRNSIFLSRGVCGLKQDREKPEREILVDSRWVTSHNKKRSMNLPPKNLQPSPVSIFPRSQQINEMFSFIHPAISLSPSINIAIIGDNATYVYEDSRQEHCGELRCHWQGRPFLFILFTCIVSGMKYIYIYI